MAKASEAVKVDKTCNGPNYPRLDGQRQGNKDLLPTVYWFRLLANDATHVGNPKRYNFLTRSYIALSGISTHL